jgi:hypothetical protein
VAGRRSEGRRDPEPWVGDSRGTRTDEDRLTSLFGGNGEGERLPIMGAVEPSCENAIDPLEHDTEGDSGRGLEFLLEVCELEMVDRRLIQEGLLVETCAARSISSKASMSLWGVKPFTIALRGRKEGSPLVILLTIRRCGRPS